MEHFLETGYHYANESPRVAFLNEIREQNYGFTRDEQLPVAGWPEELNEFIRVQHSNQNNLVDSVLFFYEPHGVVHATYHRDQLVLEMAAATSETVNALRTKIVSYFEPAEEPEDTSVAVDFWMMSQTHGARSYTRNINIPEWEEIRDNYDQEARARLEILMNMKTWDPTIGKLLLWRGKPGLGKTYALRSLLKSWNEWVEFSYITDSEVFFGSSEYLMQVLMHQSSSWIDVAGEMEQIASQKWRLIILEDAGELLGNDARSQTGQGLSRLLNVVDGMLGQGLKVILLVTTNEEISKLHDAVKRPGRCAMNLEFKKLSMEDSVTWLEERGHADKVDQVKNTTSLAELYAISQGIDVALGEKLGFA